MIRNLRAFFWLRWRTEMNRLTRSTGRDTLEQLSRAVLALETTFRHAAPFSAGVPRLSTLITT